MNIPKFVQLLLEISSNPKIYLFLPRNYHFKFIKFFIIRDGCKKFSRGSNPLGEWSFNFSPQVLKKQKYKKIGEE